MTSTTIDMKNPSEVDVGQTGTYPPPNYPGPAQQNSGPSVGASYYPQQAWPTNQVSPYAYQPVAFPQPPPPPQQQQQQQQSVVVVGGATAPTIVQQVPIESYCGYQALGCVVFWFCNCLFGLIAWILALVADSTKHSDRDEARRLGKASLGMSISGIIVTIIVISVVLGVAFGGGSATKSSSSVYSSSSSSSSSNSISCNYLVNGACYTTRRYVYASCSTFTSYAFYTCCYPYETAYSNYYCYTV